ncbi:MAG: Na+/H+ antiporter subunit E [Coriobacteriia bacterium]|nr:Na+/H+ antiporter subunit E [Coriobacteriia bacterium]
MSETPTAITPRERLRRLPGRAVGMLLVWFVVTEADIPSLVIGVPIALAAAVLSVALQPRSLSGVYLPGAIRFARFFAVNSVLGGIDVAFRALGPRMRLEPAIVHYPLRISGAFPRVFFANTISMLPGTLSSRLTSDTVEVHVLDCTRPVIEDLAQVEERVADLFGAQLSPHEGGGAL